MIIFYKCFAVTINHRIGFLFCFDSKHNCQQFFSHVGMGLPPLKLSYIAIRSLYPHVVCNVPACGKAKGDQNQLGTWLDINLIGD